MAALPRYNAIPGGGSNVVVRRAAWLRAGPFDLRLRNTEDWDMWIRLAKEGPPAWVCNPLIGYRIHTSNSSLNVAEIIRGARLIAAKHDAPVDWGRLHRWLGQSCLRSGHRLAALHHFARAAARGDAFPAASDLTALVRHAVARRLGWLAGGGLPSVNPWIESADTWLRVFREEPDHGYRSTPER
jgi:hypothetical protein